MDGNTAEGREVPDVSLCRFWGKPFVMTEFNWSAPVKYRGVSGLHVGALAGLQDWDGLWRHGWASNHYRAMGGGKYPASQFLSANDPLLLASDRAALCLYLRGDAEPLPRKCAVSVARADLQSKRIADMWPGNAVRGIKAGWSVQLGSSVDPSVPAGGYDLFIRAGKPYYMEGSVEIRHSDAAGKALGWKILKQLEQTKNCNSLYLPKGELRSYAK